jgi:hypothetical protein
MPPGDYPIMKNPFTHAFPIKVDRPHRRFIILSFGLSLLFACLPTAAEASRHSTARHQQVKAGPAKPSPELLKGCQLYTAGKYNLALPYLQSASMKSPTDWTAHYYLGHTLLLLGQKSDAVTQYRYCMGCNPKPEIVSACQSAIVSIYPEAAGSTVYTSETDNSSLMKPRADASAGGWQPHVQFEKAKIRMEAQEEERRINNDTAATSARVMKSPYARLSNSSLYGLPIVDPSSVRAVGEAGERRLRVLQEETKKKLNSVH